MTITCTTAIKPEDRRETSLSKLETSTFLPHFRGFNKLPNLGNTRFALETPSTMKRKAEEDDSAHEPRSPKSKRRATGIDSTPDPQPPKLSSKSFFRGELFDQSISDDYQRLYANSKP